MTGAFDLSPVVFPPAPEFPKVGREALALLVLETEHCPHVVRRVVGIVITSGALPFTFRLCREDRVQNIEIEFAAMAEKRALSLLHELRRVMSVRRARMLIPAERDAHAPVVAKL